MNKPIIKVKVSQLVKAKWNYKTDGSPEIIQKLIKSAEYQKSIGVPAVRELKKTHYGKPEKKYEVIDGNHRLDALLLMKIKEITVENFGKITKGAAVLIAKQRNTLWFEDDTIKFAELFKQDILKDFTIDELETMLPMSKEELEGFEKLLDFDWAQFDDAGEPILKEGYKQIKFDVPEETYNLWLKWQKRCKELLGYDKEEKCFEFAVVEAMNIPEGSLK